MRRALSILLLAAVFAAPAAHGQPAVGRGCSAALQKGGDSTTAYAAAANSRMRAYSAPGGAAVHTFRRLNRNGARTVFGVLGTVPDRHCRPAWYRVQLPIRPNGATGFVAARAVTLYPVRTRLEIDLSQRRLSLFRRGRLVLRTTVGVGAPGTPTPTGRYYVNQRLYAADPDGPYGPGAVGISAFSPVLTDWLQGGPIAVHGTSDPSSVGRAVSHGCVRVQNAVVRRLLRATVTGSPVVIHS
jgi:lipoprotein-anchoring transpeptidase ErfK/SrfK